MKTRELIEHLTKLDQSLTMRVTMWLNEYEEAPGLDLVHVGIHRVDATDQLTDDPEEPMAIVVGIGVAG